MFLSEDIIEAFLFVRDLGCALDPAKYSQLSLGEKRALVREIARWSKDAPEILRSFTRPELLEIICAEMGKERKYTGYTKSQMIEHLLKLVSQNFEGQNSFAFSPARIGLKRKRNVVPPSQLLTDLNHAPPENNEEEHVKILLCQNVACRASLTPEDAFCKRCSCCVCHYYDDNKDPSLWLTCENDLCGLSCHLECALKHERAGILKNKCCKKLDGSFYCVSCGKIHGLMRTWRKQLLVAKEARRVDVLCLRLSLAQKILLGTALYKEAHRTVDSAVKILKDEVGPLDQVCKSMARCIVNRLPCGAEVQKLCASAVASFDSMFCLDYMEEKYPFAACRIQFEESTPTSVIIVLEYEDHLLKEYLGCRLWHRKSVVKDYPEQPTFIVFRPEKRFKISHLQPSTEYSCKVSLFSSTGVLGVLEAKWETPASDRSCFTALKHGKAEHTIIAQDHLQVESTKFGNIKLAPPAKLQPLVDINKSKSERFCSPSLFIETVSPSTPCKCSGMRAVPDMGCKKRLEESDYEHSVQLVKWLEHEGHLDEDFRVKFLTWFSLKATDQERRVVNVFVATLLDDPPSLAGQLMDTFMDKICCEQKPVDSRHGFCFSLWH
ncbi:VIN3-like protein 2 isoform X2 [Juglans microcarpa x Juglans regia]|uniref:VIN3-like protein 2 isoform X2 n=1 Tax=Juglans microcarpa x Juglans regia TaxID=2249226 RepID=UPI001B7F0E12|nr:VIN3-like protein 2 isoform X2 [Juglans microcarpa x Juglans regia]